MRGECGVAGEGKLVAFFLYRVSTLQYYKREACCFFPV